jgi:hypothetical protein
MNNIDKKINDMIDLSYKHKGVKITIDTSMCANCNQITKDIVHGDLVYCNNCQAVKKVIEE